MLPQLQYTAHGRPPGYVRRKVARWGLVIIVVILSPATLVTFFRGPFGILGLGWLAFVWGFMAIGYFLGIWLCLKAEAKGLDGVTWGLLFAGPWWAFSLVAYSFVTYRRPIVRPHL